MKPLPLQEILDQIGGEIIHGSGNPIMEQVMDYSAKKIHDHTLVFHMDHERIRGKYWKDNRGIVIVTDRPTRCTDLSDEVILIEVEDLEAAFWKFIEYYRALFQLPVIGVTGTCGKTSTKEMMKQILKRDFKVVSTWMSMNSMSVNMRYLNKIDDSTEVAVFEMPVAYPGYLQVACRCFQPKIRILLNIGVHHLAYCETPEAYMQAKGEIVDGLDPEEGILILNGDDENIKNIVDVTPFKNVIYFGKNDQADFRAESIHYADGGMKFILVHDGKSYEGFVPGYGEHNIYNALAAVAGVFFVGVDISTAINRLSDFNQVKEHLEFKQGFNGCTVIDDSWNSSPLSMTTALEVLKEVANGRKTIALLGYMPQLGKGAHAIDLYQEMGKKAAETNVDLLVIVGDKAKEIGNGALQSGMASERVFFCDSGDEIYQILQPYLHNQTMILLKVTYRVMKKPSFSELRRKLIPNDK